MNQLRIRTPEGIAFSYQLAGPVARCLAVLIDLLAVSVLARVFSFLAQLGGIISTDVSQALMTVGFFIISIGYSMLTEWAWRGQTLGKRLLRLRVMDAQGLRLQEHQVVMRNLLRFVDMLPAFYLVGGIACLVSRRAQRLGDFAANTIVVHVPAQAEPDLDQVLAGKFNSLRQHPHLEARLRQLIGPEEARLGLQALLRRDELEPAARVELFADLAAHYKSLVTFPPETVEAVPDEQYVRNVVDVLFRTRAGGANQPAA